MRLEAMRPLSGGDEFQTFNSAGILPANPEIRPLSGGDEFLACERLQRAVWGTLAASSELLAVTAKYGGVVLGALTNRKVVGFIYAFLARRHGELIHWSHMMAVDADNRNRGLGFRLKLKHRQLALQQGVKAICWTYDPLQSRNATLNIARLGGRVEEYIPDCYGHFPSRIERGLDSDRFVIDWRIGSARVERRLGTAQRKTADPASRDLRAPVVNQTRFAGDGFIDNTIIALDESARCLRVEVPSNTDLMRSKALPLARRWRAETRQIFQHYLASGYHVEGFLAPSTASDGRCFYVLHKGREQM